MGVCITTMKTVAFLVVILIALAVALGESLTPATLSAHDDCERICVFKCSRSYRFSGMSLIPDLDCGNLVCRDFCRYHEHGDSEPGGDSGQQTLGRADISRSRSLSDCPAGEGSEPKSELTSSVAILDPRFREWRESWNLG